MNITHTKPLGKTALKICTLAVAAAPKGARAITEALEMRLSKAILRKALLLTGMAAAFTMSLDNACGEAAMTVNSYVALAQDGSNLSSLGSVFGAVNITGSGTNVTVGGITFAPANPNTDPTGLVNYNIGGFQFQLGTDGDSGGGVPVAQMRLDTSGIWPNGDQRSSGYSDATSVYPLVSSVAYSPGGNDTFLVLENLIVGVQYQVQVIFSCEGTRSFIFLNSANSANWSAYAYGQSGNAPTEWYGGWFASGNAWAGGPGLLTITFTADATTQSIGFGNGRDGGQAQSFAGFSVTTVQTANLGVQLSASPAYADVGSNVVVSVTIPAAATRSSAVTLAVANDNPSAVTVSSTNASATTIHFGLGVTNVTFIAQVVAADTGNLTVSGPGFFDNTIAVGGLAPRVLLEAYRASSTANINPGGGTPAQGDPVLDWAGDTNNNRIAYSSALAGNPSFDALATPGGQPAIQFAGNSTLTLQSGDNPLSGLLNFSVVVVFKASTVGQGGFGSGWGSESGIVDAYGSDGWGATIDSLGQINFWISSPDVGLGNPQGIVQTGYNVVNPLFHVAVASFDGLNGQMRVTIDNQAATASTGGVSQQTRSYSVPVDFADAGFDGEITEIQFYDGALNISETTNLVNSLKANYDLQWQSDVLMAVSAPSQGMMGSAVPVSVTIPVGLNASSPTSVVVTNDNPAALSLSSTNASMVTITFPAGTTNVQTFAAQAIGSGVANLIAVKAGLVCLPIQVAVAPQILASSFWEVQAGSVNNNRGRSLAGNTGGQAICVVGVFQLPNFGAGQNPFIAAGLSVSADEARTLFWPGVTVPNEPVDLYGLPVGVGTNATTAMYYASAAMDTTAGVSLIQTSLLNDTTVPPGTSVPLTVTNSSASAAALLSYLNAQYAGGAGAGQYVYLRFSPEGSSGTDGTGYDLYDGTGNGRTGSVLPSLNYTLAPQLTWSHSLSGLVLNWTSGTLLEATNLTGPWLPASGVTSGTPIPTTAPKMFYRVSVP